MHFELMKYVKMLMQTVPQRATYLQQYKDQWTIAALIFLREHHHFATLQNLPRRGNLYIQKKRIKAD